MKISKIRPNQGRKHSLLFLPSRPVSIIMKAAISPYPFCNNVQSHTSLRNLQTSPKSWNAAFVLLSMFSRCLILMECEGPDIRTLNTLNNHSSELSIIFLSRYAQMFLRSRYGIIDGIVVFKVLPLQILPDNNMTSSKMNIGLLIVLW